MPTLTQKPCGHPRCPNAAGPFGYCAKHHRARRQDSERNRESAHSRGYGRRWRKASKGFLRKHPLCVYCEQEGIITPATVVDHIIPHRGDRALFWASNNWQGLCKRHHDIKTAKEDGGFGRATAQLTATGSTGSAQAGPRSRPDQEADPVRIF